MKKSTIVLLVEMVVLIPGTLSLGKHLPGRGYYLASTLLILELLLPFFLAFEGRRPQARELVVVAVLCALAVAARAAIPLPHFKPIFAVILIAGVAFGPETGFLVGAVSAFASNFFYGQGAYTPWQMMAYGYAGLAGGLCFARGRIPRKRLPMALFGFGCVLALVGPILDTCTVFLTLAELTPRSAWAMYASGFPVNVSQAACTFLTLFLLGEPLLEKLERVRRKFGMTEA